MPKIFKSTNSHHLVITYDGSSLRLYVDGMRHSYSLDLNPETALFRQLFSLDARNMGGYKALYYGFVFVPLGCFLALLLDHLKRRFVIQVLLVGVSVLLLPLILESALSSVSGKSLDVETIIFSATLIVAGILLSNTKRNSKWRTKLAINL